MSPIMHVASEVEMDRRDVSHVRMRPRRRNALADIFQGVQPDEIRAQLAIGRGETSEVDNEMSPRSFSSPAPILVAVGADTEEQEEVLDIVHSSRYRRRRNALHDLGLGQNGLQKRNHFT